MSTPVDAIDRLEVDPNAEVLIEAVGQAPEGKIPERWKEKPAKIRQKDRDARWSLRTSAGAWTSSMIRWLLAGGSGCSTWSIT